MKKMHLIAYPLTAFIAIGIGASTADSSTATSQTETVTRTVTQAPAECGTALDLAAEFTLAVADEHAAMGEAFEQAGVDGDMITMAESITEATNTMTATIVDLTPKIDAASEVCRAAVK